MAARHTQIRRRNLEERKMLIEAMAIKFIAGKLAAAHAAHVAAAKAAFTVHHPLSTALQQTAHHGLTSIMKDPAIHPAVKAALVQSIQHGPPGAAGIVAGPAGTGSVAHAAGHLAEAEFTPLAAWLVRETDAYQDLKKLLSDWRED
jgi:hypothetical protein